MGNRHSATTGCVAYDEHVSLAAPATTSSSRGSSSASTTNAAGGGGTTLSRVNGYHPASSHYAQQKQQQQQFTAAPTTTTTTTNGGNGVVTVYNGGGATMTNGWSNHHHNLPQHYHPSTTPQPQQQQPHHGLYVGDEMGVVDHPSHPKMTNGAAIAYMNGHNNAAGGGYMNGTTTAVVANGKAAPRSPALSTTNGGGSTPKSNRRSKGGSPNWLANFLFVKKPKKCDYADDRKGGDTRSSGADHSAGAISNGTTGGAIGGDDFRTSFLVNGKQVCANEVTVVPDRPALRLDSKLLVCKYEVISVIGKGSFSQVLRVKHRLNGEFYAVKLVTVNDQDFNAVNNELTILSHVEHENVIRLEEVFRSPLKLFIVMEMASGGEMYDRVITKGRYTEQESRHAVIQLLTGLVYLHSKLITHRDLKPENLLYSDSSPNARLLITDFGLAHEAKVPDEKMVDTCGTPEYISPEILLRIPYSNKVDMWAVGVITYILMSGIMPFDDDCRSRLYTQIITANYVYYPQYWSGSDLAKEFVDALLETISSNRLSATDALNHCWVTGQKPLPPVAKPSPQDAHRCADDDRHTEANSVQRTKSSRSIRSVTRSDHGHRVDPGEVDKLAEDLQRLADKQRRERELRFAAAQQHYQQQSRLNGGNGGGANAQQQQNGHHHHGGGGGSTSTVNGSSSNSSGTNAAAAAATAARRQHSNVGAGRGGNGRRQQNGGGSTTADANRRATTAYTPGTRVTADSATRNTEHGGRLPRATYVSQQYRTTAQHQPHLQQQQLKPPLPPRADSPASGGGAKSAVVSAPRHSRHSSAGASAIVAGSPMATKDYGVI